ncbi:hypothetical protein BDV93DRAFT_565232 [Ceratobasidium sp. AG-I]|nr:hypothetical protein BDV93DRAFT_565232 [Ceratobasidium sp. AG-I]
MSATCNTVFAWPRKCQRLLAHMGHCNHLPVHLWASSDASLGAQSRAARVEALASAGTKWKAEEATTPSDTSNPATGSLPKKARLDHPVSSTSNRMVETASRAAKKKALQATLDDTALNFLCENAIAPNVVDSHSWHKFIVDFLALGNVPVYAIKP